MAVSEDIRGVQAMLGGLQEAVPVAYHTTLQLLCDNLLALAEQAEALEDLPLVDAGCNLHDLPTPFLPLEVLRLTRFATA